MDSEQSRSKGFTLYEIIIFLVLMGIFSLALVQFVRTSTQSSVVAFNWLREENTLQRAMEDVVSRYKKVVTETAPDAVTLQSDLEALKIYVETNHGDQVVAAETGYIYFDSSGVASWPPRSTITAAEPVLIVTLRDGDQRLSSLFMASQ